MWWEKGGGFGRGEKTDEREKLVWSGGEKHKYKEEYDLREWVRVMIPILYFWKEKNPSSI